MLDRIPARQAYRALSGLFCIYKPAQRAMAEVINSIKLNLVRDLNKLECRPPRTCVVFNEQSESSSLVPAVSTVTDLADHPLVVGDRYILDDISLHSLDALDYDASGIVVMAIGRTQNLLRKISEKRQLRTYHVEGELGLATQDCKTTGNIIEKTTYFHITHAKIDKVIAGIQAGHQKNMYVAAEVDPQSEEAYAMAVSGLIQPKSTKTQPVVYGIKCVEFQPPYFTLEVHAINERCSYLRWLVHQLGLEMRASAACALVRRVRYGHVGLEHALLSKHWNVDGVLQNIGACRPVFSSENVPRLEASARSTLQRQLAEGLRPAGRLNVAT